MAGLMLPRQRFVIRDHDIVAECRNGSEVGTALKSSRVHLLFLDIQMPSKSGLEVI